MLNLLHIIFCKHTSRMVMIDCNMCRKLEGRRYKFLKWHIINIPWRIEGGFVSAAFSEANTRTCSVIIFYYNPLRVTSLRCYEFPVIKWYVCGRIVTTCVIYSNVLVKSVYYWFWLSQNGSEIHLNGSCKDMQAQKDY